MTFLEVAQTVNLTTTSITYYFRFKENLAAAVFEHTLQRLEAIVDEAAQESDLRARIAAFCASISIIMLACSRVARDRWRFCRRCER